MRQVVVTAGLLLVCAGLFAQEQPKDSVASAAQQQQERCGRKKLDQYLKDLAHDQAGIWTSPLRLNSHDGFWLVPFAGATGAAFAYDEDALRQVGTMNRGLVNKSETISEFGSPYATFGEAGALYVLGALKHDDHLRETGILGAEAVANASLVAEGLKLATNRERPNEGLGTGRFWPQGTRNYSLDSSFPSGHAAASWALARVIASEYPGWWTKLGAYSIATAISASRITGRQHFPSDVVVGGTFGYLIGGYVVRHHSSADQAKTTYALLPTFDRAPHAYGVTLILSRNVRQVEESEQAVKDLSPIASWSNQEPQTKPQTESVPPASPSTSPPQDDSEGKQSKHILWIEGCGFGWVEEKPTTRDAKQRCTAFPRAKVHRAPPSPGSGQHWVSLCSKELHDEPAISYVTDRCSALTLVNSDGCGVFVTHRGRIVSGCSGLQPSELFSSAL